jgi:hypothetical protein
MPPQFLQSMLIIPKDQLHKYKLHKVVLLEYNEYIQETCQVVHDISNKLSTHISYSCTKNIKRKSKNSFPSFKNKLNELLLKYAEEFGFVEDSQKKQLPTITITTTTTTITSNSKVKRSKTTTTTTSNNNNKIKNN